MSVLLLVVGAIAVMLGVGMAAWGIPINEFSFGNTLIVAGTTMASGGLIVISLGAAVGQLQRIAEALAARDTGAEAHAFAPLPEAALAGALAARMPFPSKPSAEPAVREPSAPPAPPAMPPPLATAEQSVPSAAPNLRNPEAPPPFAVDEEVLLSPPPEPKPDDVASARPPRLNGGGAGHPAPVFEPRRPPSGIPASNFDAMWPPEPEPAVDQPPPPPEKKPEPAASAAPAKPRDVAILKSGVVDGMAYTLYVDGSIEAELPQGTVHFASIEELRGHLEQNSSS